MVTHVERKSAWSKNSAAETIASRRNNAAGTVDSSSSNGNAAGAIIKYKMSEGVFSVSVSDSESEVDDLNGTIKTSATMTQSDRDRDPVVSEDAVQITVQDVNDADLFDFDMDEVFGVDPIDVDADAETVNPVDLVAFAETREQLLRDGGESASVAIDVAVQEYNKFVADESAPLDRIDETGERPLFSC